MGVMGRTSDNRLILETIGWQPNEDLESGLIKTYQWIAEQIRLGKGDI
jgi:nucleoside-diphosphate-sugar epimerase